VENDFDPTAVQSSNEDEFSDNNSINSLGLSGWESEDEDGGIRRHHDETEYDPDEEGELLDDSLNKAKNDKRREGVLDTQRARMSSIFLEAVRFNRTPHNRGSRYSHNSRK